MGCKHQLRQLLVVRTAFEEIKSGLVRLVFALGEKESGSVKKQTKKVHLSQLETAPYSIPAGLPIHSTSPFNSQLPSPYFRLYTLFSPSLSRIL